MCIDHIGIAISDYQRSKQFYTQVLATLNIELIVEVDGWAGFGKKNNPYDKADF